MKGGTTSGTVYPGAVKQIMKRYRLVNVGGTSAGAIAAAAAAVAEIGRDEGSLGQLDKIPEDFKNGGLLSLFQPRTESEFLFNIAKAWIDSKDSDGERFSSKLTKLWIGEYWLISLLLFGVAFLGGVGFVALSNFGTAFQIVGYALIILLILVAAIGWVVFSIFKTWKTIQRQLTSSYGFGLCPGANQSDSEKPAFANWFSDHLRILAGKPNLGRPVTFGDLKRPKFEAELPPINLLILTTSLTEGKMVTLPFEDPDPKGDRYLFREEDWRGKIPDDDLDWMINSASPVPPEELGERKDGHSAQKTGYYFLPEKDQLPVILAVRMSLSFPFLFTTTKLYRLNQGDKSINEIEFSDGGITSNFPIHFFDNVWPKRPTFGITLTRTECDDDLGSAPSFIKDSRVCNAKRIANVGDFVTALLTTMQEWADNQQSELLSASQRIVQIPLKEGEGGLNLTMDDPTVENLISQGIKAGKVFEDFEWDEHRWTRYVSSMVSFADVTRSMNEVWKENSDSDGNSFREFIQSRTSDTDLGLSKQWFTEALEFADKLVNSDLKAELEQKIREDHKVKLKIVAEQPK